VAVLLAQPWHNTIWFIPPGDPQISSLSAWVNDVSDRFHKTGNFNPGQMLVLGRKSGMRTRRTHRLVDRRSKLRENAKLFHACPLL
jgi:hypothetical protein